MLLRRKFGNSSNVLELVCKQNVTDKLTPIFIHKTGYSVPYRMEQSMSIVEDLVVEMLGDTKDMVGVR